MNYRTASGKNLVADKVIDLNEALTADFLEMNARIEEMRSIFQIKVGAVNLAYGGHPQSQIAFDKDFKQMHIFYNSSIEEAEKSQPESPKEEVEHQEIVADEQPELSEDFD